MPQHLRSKTVTARKVHRCMTCGAPAVQPGETYRRETLIYDGHIYDWVMCKPCDEIFGEVATEYGYDDEGVGSDQFNEWAWDHRKDKDQTVAEQAKAYLLRSLGEGYQGDDDE